MVSLPLVSKSGARFKAYVLLYCRYYIVQAFILCLMGKVYPVLRLESKDILSTSR